MDSTAFIDRKLHRVPDVEMDRLGNKRVLPETDYKLADDWVMVIRESATDTKYGRIMYSKSLDQLRCPTMGEFYGTGIVD